MYKKLGMAALAGAATYGLASKHREPFDPYRPGPVPPGWRHMDVGSYHKTNADGTYDDVTYYRYLRHWRRHTNFGGGKDPLDHGFFETFDEAINFKPKRRGSRNATVTHNYKVIRKQRGLPGFKEKTGRITLPAALSAREVRAAIGAKVGPDWSIVFHARPDTLPKPPRKGRRNMSGFAVAEEILGETYIKPRRGESRQSVALRQLQAAEDYAHEASESGTSDYNKRELRDADRELERRIKRIQKHMGSR